MQNRTALSIKVVKPVANLPDAPFTPVDRTLQTPIEVPPLNSYFSTSDKNSASLNSNATYSESEDVLTDVDEAAGPNVSQTYSLTFTPQFDQFLMQIYTQIILLPTITPFLGNVPPLGIVSKVASEAMANLLARFTSPDAATPPPVFDAQKIINKDRLQNAAFKHILLLLIRRRLLDLCSALFNQFCPSYTPQLLEPTSVLIVMSLLTSNGLSANGCGGSLYGSMGWNPLSTCSLLSGDLGAPRLLSSSLNLRKQSLSRVNSCSASSWLHVGAISGTRPNHTQSFTRDYDGSTDSLQLMHDYVPASVIPRSTAAGAASNPHNSALSMSFGRGPGMGTQTPPGIVRPPFALDTPTPPVNVGRDSGFHGQKLFFESERPCLTRRTHPGALTIAPDGPGFGSSQIDADFALDSPFASSSSVSEKCNHFSPQTSALGASSCTSADDGGRLRSGRLISESPVEDCQTQSHRANGFSLSERQRDSLKLKRGIH